MIDCEQLPLFLGQIGQTLVKELPFLSLPILEAFKIVETNAYELKQRLSLNKNLIKRNM